MIKPTNNIFLNPLTSLEVKKSFIKGMDLRIENKNRIRLNNGRINITPSKLYKMCLCFSMPCEYFHDQFYFSTKPMIQSRNFPHYRMLLASLLLFVFSCCFFTHTLIQNLFT